VIDGETYGYQQVNVAAQQADPNSLLNWVKHLIQVRKAHPLFGRGNFRFLLPENEAVLAYLRTYQGEVVLTIGNLADSARTAMWNLNEYAGVAPVDLLSQERFAPITAEPYALSLQPFEYRWLKLQ